MEKNFETPRSLKSLLLILVTINILSWIVLWKIPLARTSKYQGSFRYSGAKIWNTLPSDLRNVRDMSLFKSGLKSTSDAEKCDHQ